MTSDINSSTSSCDLNETIVATSTNQDDTQSKHDTELKQVIFSSEEVVANVTTTDQNNNKPRATEMNIETHGDKTLAPYQNTSETERRLLMKFMSRMETHFTNALDKICTQPTALLTSKLEKMDNVYMQSIQSNENRFSKLMDKFDDVINKKTNVERDNEELRTRLDNLNHTSTLEKEILKNKLGI